MLVGSALQRRNARGGLHMAKLLEFEGPNGSVTFAVPATDEEIEAVGRGKDIVERVGRSVGELFGMVSSIAEGFAEAIKDAPVDSAEVEFGLQFTGKASVYVVEVETQGALRVTLHVEPRSGGVAPTPEAS
jgi:hypothetical protein